MSTYTPSAVESLDELAALFAACHWAPEATSAADWRDHCAGMADLYDRLYHAAVLAEELPPVWQRMALLTSRDYFADRAEEIDRGRR